MNGYINCSLNAASRAPANPKSPATKRKPPTILDIKFPNHQAKANPAKNTKRKASTAISMPATLTEAAFAAFLVTFAFASAM